MTTSAVMFSPSNTSVRALPLANAILRIGAALCFIGHGAFGFITKAAWLPYFAVAGIPASVAWRMMPLIGTVDLLAAAFVLIAPRRLPVLYMVLWGTWTALLRPLAGEPMFEALERAGNYGVPLAFLLLAGWPISRSWRSIMGSLGQPRNDARTLTLVREVLKWTTVLLLAGHGALGITGKAMLTAHYAAIGLPAVTTSLVGWSELAIAASLVVRPYAGVLIFVAAWKLATESLFLLAGQPIWEFVERSGSYAAPLALAVLLAMLRAQAMSAKPEAPRVA